MKHNLRLLTMLVMVGFFMFSAQKTYAQTATAPASGDGTTENPYEIASLENLHWLSQNDSEWDKHYIQTANIDARETVGWDNDSGFTPIGNIDTQFTGTYNGQNFSIDSLFIDRPEINGVGLFGYISGTSGVVSNIKLTNVNITGKHWVGGVVGRIVDATVEKVSSTGQVSGYFYVGGIVGHSTNGIINYAYSKVSVSADTNEAGGLAGKVKGGNIQNSYARGDVSADARVGGFIGYLSNGAVSNCYSTGSVSANNMYNGFIGTFSGTSSNCFYDKETSGLSIGHGATGLTTVEMKNIMNYLTAGWDFINEDINGTNYYWGINETDNNAYPFLWWQGYTSLDECYEPYRSVTNISISKNKKDTITIESYENFTAEGYVIYANDTSDFADLPNGENPDVNTIWQNNGQQCIYNGTSTNPKVDLCGLTHYEEYFIKIYSYNSCDGQRLYENNGEVISVLMVKPEKPEGDGSDASPFLIETMANLIWLSENDDYWSNADMHYKQVADINASDTHLWGNGNGEGFCPIGNYEKPFKGTYDGNGHIIDSLYINRPETNEVGFFGYTNDAWIKEVGFTNLDVTGYNNVGGIIGRTDETLIQRTFTTGEISANSNLGGIVGRIHERELQDSYSRCILTGDHTIGGIAGYISTYVTVRRSYCTGAITGNSQVSGGVYGYKRDHSTTNLYDCTFDSETTGCGGSLGKTTEEMKSKETFSDMNWEFAENNEDDNYTWAMNDRMNDGYPLLQWQWKGPKPIIQDLDTIVGTCSASVDVIPEATTIFGDTINGVTDSSLSYNTLGEYLITWEYQGDGGRTSVQEQKVIVKDEVAPEITSIENQEFEIEGESMYYTVSSDVLDIKEYSDNCEISELSNDFNESATLDGAKIPEGTTTITWTVKDIAGNTKSCSYDVTVNKTTTAINDILEDNLKIYPNPVSDKLFVISENKHIQSIDIYDLTGKLIYSDTSVSETEEIDFSGFDTGVYIISLTTNKSKITRKLIKK